MIFYEGPAFIFAEYRGSMWYWFPLWGLAVKGFVDDDAALRYKEMPK